MNGIEPIEQLLDSYHVESSLIGALIYVLGFVLALWILYIFYIRITKNMAEKRNRDPLGWILLSILVSPIVTWIILLIVGKSDRPYRR